MAEYIIKLPTEKIPLEQMCLPMDKITGEVVRCKDCVWWGTDGMCENSDSPCFQNGCTHGNWYCADGERRTDDA